MSLKSIGLKILTTALIALLAFQAPLQSLRVAAASTSYISDMIISYGNSDEEAKNWLTKNGYKIVNQNLNEGGEGGSSAMSWLGLASKKRSVYLGYKTTTKAEEAITDMKIMNMNGGYSYQAYEQVLENTRKEKEHFLNNIMAALKEYRENYAAGKTKAKITHDNLNKFRDDDSGQLIGDLLLNTLKTEDEAAWEADPTQHADMVTILMQGNSTCVSEILQNLAFAAGTEEESWLNRAIDKVRTQNLDIIATDTEEKPAPSAEETAEEVEIEWKSGLELLMDDYQERFPTYDKDTLITLMIAEYDNDAKMMASSLVGLHNYLTNYTKSELSANSSKEEMEAYFAEHEFEDPGMWASACTLYDLLSTTYYDSEPLLNYLVYNDYDYLSDSDYLEGYEDFQLPQRALLYPLIDTMSEGQRCLLEYTAMDRMITMGLMDEETWASTNETLQDPEFGASDFEPCSVYAEVNRDDFKVGSIAVTNMAQGKEASTGQTMNNGIGLGVSYISVGLMIGGVAVSVAGIVLAAKNWTSGSAESLKNIVNSSANIQNSVVIEAGKDLKNIGIVSALKQNPIKLSNYTKTYTNMQSYMSTTDLFASTKNNVFNSYGSIVQHEGNFVTASPITKMTVSGPNQKIVIDVRSKFDDTTQTITTFDGRKISFENGTKQVIYDESIDQTKRTGLEINNGLSAIGKETAKISKDAYDDALKTVTKIKSDPNMNINTLSINYSSFDNKFQKNLDLDFSEPLNINELTDKQLDTMADNLDDLKYNDLAEKIRDFKNARKTVENYKVQQAYDKIDDMNRFGDKLDDASENAMTAATGSTFWKWFGVGMAIIGLAMSAYGVYSMISDMKAYYHVDMLPIPRKMVDLGYQADGSSCYIYYDCIKCNRSEQGMRNDTLEDYGDLNGDVMKQWLALYTTKDRRAGSPITASIVVKKGTTSIPLKTIPLSFFGMSSAVNMTDTKYTYNDKKNGIYLYYKVDTNAGYTGTVTTGGMLATVGVLSAFGGAGICAALMTVFGRRKKETAEAPAA